MLDRCIPSWAGNEKSRWERLWRSMGPATAGQESSVTMSSPPIEGCVFQPWRLFDSGDNCRMFARFHLRARVVLSAILVTPGVAAAQPAATPHVTVPTVIVTAQKEPADAQKVPVSVTAVPQEWLRASDVTFISDAAIFAPNTLFTEF